MSDKILYLHPEQKEVEEEVRFPIVPKFVFAAYLCIMFGTGVYLIAQLLLA